MTDLIRPDQILTLLAFLGGLGVVWALVIRNKAALGARLAQNRRIVVSETTALGPTDRAMILSVDGRDYLLLRLKGAAPLFQPLLVTDTTRPSAAQAKLPPGTDVTASQVVQ